MKTSRACYRLLLRLCPADLRSQYGDEMEAMFLQSLQRARGLGVLRLWLRAIVDGFAGRPKAEAVRFMEAHPDIYADTPRGPRLAIRDGAIEIGSLATPGLGATAEPDYAAMEPMPKADWP